MSDYARTTIAYPVLSAATGMVLRDLAPVLESVRDREKEMLIRTFAEGPEQYSKQEGVEWPSPAPSQLTQVAPLHSNLALHLGLLVNDQSYDCSVLAFKVAGTVKTAPSTFLRISFPSTLTAALRGSQEFGGVVRIEESVKKELVGLFVRTAKVLAAGGFLFGPEGGGCQPFTPESLVRYLTAPAQVAAPMPFWCAGVDDALVSRDELFRIWHPDSPLLRSGRYNILDALQDSDDDDDDEEVN